MVMTGIAWPGQLLKSFETLPVSSQGFPDNQEFIARTNASILEIKSPCKICTYALFQLIHIAAVSLLLYRHKVLPVSLYCSSTDVTIACFPILYCSSSGFSYIYFFS